MDITNLLDEDLIEIGLQATSKEEVLQKASQVVYQSGRLTNRESYFEGLIERERTSTTGFGEGIAIPHAKIKEVVQPTISIIKLENSVDWNALDGQPVKLVIALAVPEQDEGTLHLQLLAKLSEQLMEEDFREELLQADSKGQVYDVIRNVF